VRARGGGAKCIPELRGGGHTERGEKAKWYSQVAKGSRESGTHERKRVE